MWRYGNTNTEDWRHHDARSSGGTTSLCVLILSSRSARPTWSSSASTEAYRSRSAADRDRTKICNGGRAGNVAQARTKASKSRFGLRAPNAATP